MRKMKRTAIVLVGAMSLAACSPGMYTGGGWEHTAGDMDNKASFAFSVENCESETLGHFSLNDEGWKVPVEMNGHVMDFGELGEFGDNCSFYALLEYVSANPDYPGEGHAVVCFGNEGEQAENAVAGNIWVSVQSGPFKAYKNYGPIFGNAQSHGCDS